MASSATQLRFRGLEPWIIPAAAELFELAAYYGLHPRVTSVRRSYQQQAVLYQRFLRGLSQLPAAPPGRSLHEVGRAFDMVSDDPAYLGRIWNQAGGRWFAADPVHFEVR